MQKVITIVVAVLVVVGLGVYLFKISPQEAVAPATSYNAALNTKDIKPLTVVPPFNPNIDRYQGNPKAKNVFIEYADFQCPGCAAYSEILKTIPTDFTDTVFVYRYFPLIQIHKNATEVALAAEAAGAQGKYWEMHDILFAKRTEWEDMNEPLESFATYAKSVGVSNIDQFKADITSKKYLTAIQTGFNEAIGLKLPGTPSFYFNGHSLENKDLAGLKKQSEEFLNK